MFYQNLSYSEKTFYGVTFKYGEINEVPGFINDDSFISVPAPKQEKKPEKIEPEVKEPAPKKDNKKSEQKNPDDLAKKE